MHAHCQWNHACNANTDDRPIKHQTATGTKRRQNRIATATTRNGTDFLLFLCAFFLYFHFLIFGRAVAGSRWKEKRRLKAPFRNWRHLGLAGSAYRLAGGALFLCRWGLKCTARGILIYGRQFCFLANNHGIYFHQINCGTSFRENLNGFELENWDGAIWKMRNWSLRDSDTFWKSIFHVLGNAKQVEVVSYLNRPSFTNRKIGYSFVSLWIYFEWNYNKLKDNIHHVIVKFRKWRDSMSYLKVP